MAMKVTGEVVSQIMELKTANPGVTRKEEIKTGFNDIKDYSKYLQGKYSYMNSGSISMQGVPITVSVSAAFLRKCKDDPERAAYLEENLSAIPECIKRSVNFFKNMGGMVMTFESITFDDNGNIAMVSGSTNDPDGKIAKENAKRKAAEERAARKKSEDRRAKEKEETEGRKGNSDTGFSFSVIGTDINEISSQLMEKWTEGIICGTAGVDLKA